MTMIEPHATLLKKPEQGSLLYKVFRPEYFTDMIEKSYIYFSRVDKFPSDPDDSNLPREDRELVTEIKFENSDTTWANILDRGRVRTYATSFSMSESEYLWKEYGKNNPDSICIVFDSEKLIEHLNIIFREGKLIYNNLILNNFFFINHGIVGYYNGNNLQKKEAKLLNPIEYVYSKKHDFNLDNEFRTSLSCFGIYEKYIINHDNQEIGFDFPNGLAFGFNYAEAKIKNVIKEIKFNYRPSDKYFDKIKNLLKAKGLELVLPN